jgi:hypothetical protein
MNRSRCASCGLVNFDDAAECRRCGSLLAVPMVVAERPAAHRPSVGQRLAWVAGVTLVILFTWYVSLLASSDGLSDEQRLAVSDAIAVLEQSGFTHEARVLSGVVRYRGTDHWWNEYVGHPSAYAATNFPFAVITLYAPFFRYALDETERAAILLHESYHVLGANEKSALLRTWLAKHRIGWTADHYGHSRVWRNTREWTADTLPELFSCGADGLSECIR